MTVGIINTIKELSFSEMQRFWKRAQKEDLTGLNKNETLLVKIMLDHIQGSEKDLKLMHHAIDFKKFGPKNLEAIMHFKFHAIVQSQVENKSPKEVHQFFQSMTAQKCSSHEAFHLLGHVIAPFLFDVFECDDDFDLSEYKHVLKKFKNSPPEKISQLIDEEYDIYDDEDEEGLPESFLEQIPSYLAEDQLDELIDEVNEEGVPLIIQNSSGEKAFLVPYFLFSDMSGIPLDDEKTEPFETGKPKGKVIPFPSPATREKGPDAPLPLDSEHPEIFQFKISLKGAKPPIWRRLQVPSDFTFWDLHQAIQDVMGWEDTHLHGFLIQSNKSEPATRIGLPEEGLDASQLTDWKVRINQFLSEGTPTCTYIYDFGDDWIHEITLEKTLKRKKTVQYPICTTGKKACPPENSGGIMGYQMMVAAYRDSNHEAHEHSLQLLGKNFDPVSFDATQVRFTDSRERWDKTYGNEQISF